MSANDVAAGMAKYMCSEFWRRRHSSRTSGIHGGYRYLKVRSSDWMRDAPFLLIGEGTSEIQKQIIETTGRVPDLTCPRNGIRAAPARRTWYWLIGSGIDGTRHRPEKPFGTEQLADELGISVTPVREALFAQDEGLLVRSHWGFRPARHAT